MADSLFHFFAIFPHFVSRPINRGLKSFVSNNTFIHLLKRDKQSLIDDD